MGSFTGARDLFDSHTRCYMDGWFNVCAKKCALNPIRISMMKIDNSFASNTYHHFKLKKIHFNTFNEIIKKSYFYSIWYWLAECCWGVKLTKNLRWFQVLDNLIIAKAFSVQHIVERKKWKEIAFFCLLNQWWQQYSLHFPMHDHFK